MIPFMDLHCDLIEQLYLHPGSHMRENCFQLDLKRMKAAGCIAQNFAIMQSTGAVDVTAEYRNKRKLFYKELELNCDIIGQVRSFSELEHNYHRGKISAILTLEGADLSGEKTCLSELQGLYDDGIRMIAPVWNRENHLGYPSKYSAGLKKEGIIYVQEMERMGIIVDVSHLSDRGFFDVAENTKKPFVASHSNARAVSASWRNLSDNMIRLLGERQGIIGLNFYPKFVDNRFDNNARAGLDKLLSHIKHITNVGGRGIVCLGADFDGMDFISGDIGSVSELYLLARAMEQAGWRIDEIESIFYKNSRRFYEEVLV